MESLIGNCSCSDTASDNLTRQITSYQHTTPLLLYQDNAKMQILTITGSLSARDAPGVVPQISQEKSCPFLKGFWQRAWDYISVSGAEECEVCNGEKLEAQRRRDSHETAQKYITPVTI